MDEWVTIARVLRARGNRGEVAAEPLSSRQERYEQLRQVYLFGEAGQPEGQPAEVEEVWEHKGHVIFKFRGIDTISDAEKLRGVEIRLPMAERPALPDGEYYHSDLVGCAVMEKDTGLELGKVAAVQDAGGPPILAVQGPEGEILVPLAKSICIEIDIAGRRIVVDPPAGLKELNRA